MMTRKPEEQQRRVHLGCKWQGEVGLCKGVHHGEGAAPTKTPEMQGPQHFSWISPQEKEENLRTGASLPRTGLQGS